MQLALYTVLRWTLPDHAFEQPSPRFCWVLTVVNLLHAFGKVTFSDTQTKITGWLIWRSLTKQEWPGMAKTCSSCDAFRVDVKLWRLYPGRAMSMSCCWLAAGMLNAAGRPLRVEPCVPVHWLALVSMDWVQSACRAGETEAAGGQLQHAWLASEI